MTDQGHLRALDGGADRELLESAVFEIKRIIAGQDEMLERVFVCLLAGGHLLIEGVPGLAKTLTVKTVADVFGGRFERVQFTPDLVPADLVGTRMYRASSEEFDIELGPVFCNFLLADEINRAPAKVQSALLEVMQERQVTIGKETYPVPAPFLVMATQNPIESEGTYPLPEAQVDRFMLKIVVDYPAEADELTVIERALGDPIVVEQLVSSRSWPACRRRRGASTSTPPSRATRSRSPSRHAGCPTAAWPTSRSTSRTVRARAGRSTSSSAPGRSPCCAVAATCCPTTCASWPRTCCATGWC